MNLLTAMRGLYLILYFLQEFLESLLSGLGASSNMAKVSVPPGLLLLANIDDKYGSQHIYDFMINYIGINRKCSGFH